MRNRKESGFDDERVFSLRRLRTLIIGILVVIVAGLVAVNLFTYMRYGGTMFDGYFEKNELKSPMAGKLAFDKRTKFYIGIIRGEGNTAGRGNVYFIEQAGGSMIEVSKENVEVRDPEKIEK